MKSQSMILCGLLGLALAIELVSCTITVQIGGATRLNSLNRQRDRYTCFWDCDLVGCQIARDDDECAYDCDRICRFRYDYSARSDELKPKSDGTADLSPLADNELGELKPVGPSVRLHLPRNVSARNFGIWERCSNEGDKLVEKPMAL